MSIYFRQTVVFSEAIKPFEAWYEGVEILWASPRSNGDSQEPHQAARQQQGGQTTAGILNRKIALYEVYRKFCVFGIQRIQSL